MRLSDASVKKCPKLNAKLSSKMEEENWLKPIIKFHIRYFYDFVKGNPEIQKK